MSEVLQPKFLRMFKHGLTYDHAWLSGSIKVGSANDSFLIFYCENFRGSALLFYLKLEITVIAPPALCKMKLFSFK